MRNKREINHGINIFYKGTLRYVRYDERYTSKSTNRVWLD